MGIHRAEAGAIRGGERYFWSTEECSCLSLKLSAYFNTSTRKAPGSSPVLNRPQQSRSDRAPSQTSAPNHAGKEAPHVGTSLHLCADKKCAGDESLPTATPRESPLGARRVFVEQEPTEQTEGRESQGDRAKRGPLTSRRVRKRNYPCEKERQLQFHFENQIPPYRTGYCPLRPGGRKKESKIVTGGEKKPKQPSSSQSFKSYWKDWQEETANERALYL